MKQYVLAAIILSVSGINFDLHGEENEALPSQAKELDEQAAYPLVDYEVVIDRVASMVRDGDALDLAEAQGLDIVEVQWEDTGRYENSSYGPNISDVTISVVRPAIEDTGEGLVQGPGVALTPMPVLRFPNFTDKTADLPIESIFLLAGNEKKGQALQPVRLDDFLRDIPRYMSDPSQWAGANRSLLAARDTHVLTSAQAAFLPIPKGGEAEFHPTIYNYQSIPFDPAVLVILATPAGTSLTIVENAGDDDNGIGQLLFFK